MAADLSRQAITSYEHGTRTMPVDRLVDIAHAFGIRPSVLIEEAYTAAFGPPSEAVRINLTVLAATTAPGLVALRRWANVRTRQMRDEDTTLPFSAAALDCMATLCGLNRADLVTALAEAGAT
jgi:transcriptional regulator with XRE-family HTH domain